MRANTPGNSAAMIASGPTSTNEGITPSSPGGRASHSGFGAPSFFSTTGPYPPFSFSSTSGGFAFFASASSTVFTNSALVPLKVRRRNGSPCVNAPRSDLPSSLRVPETENQVPSTNTFAS